MAGQGVGPVGHGHADGVAMQQTDAAGQPEVQAVAVEQEEHRGIGLQGLRGDDRPVVQHHLRLALVDRQASELGQVLAVAGAAQRLLHARVGADVADGGHHVGLAMVVQRAQRDLDHDLAAVLAPRHQFHLHAHRPRPRCLGVAAPVVGMAAADGLRHQRIDVQADEFVCGIAQQPRRRRVGAHDMTVGVDHQQRVRVGDEQRQQQRVGVGACHSAVTVGTRM